VSRVSLDPIFLVMAVEFDETAGSAQGVLDALDAAGYVVERVTPEQEAQLRPVEFPELPAETGVTQLPPGEEGCSEREE